MKLNEKGDGSWRRDLIKSWLGHDVSSLTVTRRKNASCPRLHSTFFPVAWDGSRVPPPPLGAAVLVMGHRGWYTGETDPGRCLCCQLLIELN